LIVNEELVLNLDNPKRIKGGVEFKKQEERFKPEPEHRDPWRAERHLTEMIANYDKIEDAIKPNVHAPFFNSNAK
jgi:hypothetical protein